MAAKESTDEKQLEFSLDRLDRQSLLSLGLGAIVVVVVGLLVFNYFTQLRSEPGQAELAQEEAAPETELALEPTEILTTHVIQPKEHLWSLAKRYYDNGFLWVKIAEVNQLADPDRVLAGTELIIPKIDSLSGEKLVATTTIKGVETGEKITGHTYLVQEADNLCKIARRAYGECQRGWEIARANRLHKPHLIFPGQELVIPRDN